LLSRRPQPELILPDHPHMDLGLLYAPRVGSQLWIGAAVTLIGVALGGVISLALNRQQMRDARLQRAEQAVRQAQQASAERRIQAYADFLTRARAYRNIVRDYCLPLANKPSLADVNNFMRAANDASALVFLLVEDASTYESCRQLLWALSEAQDAVHQMDPASKDNPWHRLSGTLASAVRNFQIAVRKELNVKGIPDDLIRYRHVPDDNSGPRISEP
jgi:hypothetical protein